MPREWWSPDARQVVISSRGKEQAQMDPAIQRLLEHAPRNVPTMTMKALSTPHRTPSEVTEEEVKKVTKKGLFGRGKAD